MKRGMHGAEGTGTRSGDNGVATTHATLATLTSLGPVYVAPRARAVYQTEPKWGKPSVAAKKRTVPTHGRRCEGEVEQVEQEQVVEPVAGGGAGGRDANWVHICNTSS